MVDKCNADQPCCSNTYFQCRLRRETVPAATGKDGLRAIQIVEAVYQSAAAGGTPVKLSPL
ncbi:MAG: hypothetical protein HY232_05035 [Acidobacteria bacterium]|nr:hypothetical protein [Acidobacteriota bacterium]